MAETSDAPGTWEPVAGPSLGPAPGMSQAPHTGTLSEYERNWAPWVHISALSALVSIPLGNILGPLICWLITKDRSGFLDDQGKQALNFQIGVTIVVAVLAAVAFVSMWLAILIFPVVAAVVAIFGAIVVVVFALVHAVIAGIQASKGVWYRYPMSFQFIR